MVSAPGVGRQSVLSMVGQSAIQALARNPPTHYGCRMSIPASSPWSWAWARTPFWRILGSFVSWFLFALSLTWLLQGFTSVLSMGGACASGPSAYEIAVECPNNTGFMVPAVFGGLIAVGISVVIGQGFGTSLADLAWPTLFGSLGAGFISAGGPVGYGIGAMFAVLALVPLALALRVSTQRVLIGAVSAHGERYYEGEKQRSSPFGLRYPRANTTIRANAGHWALSLIVCVAGVALGYTAGLATL